jgi:hypothetical protein
VLDLDAYFPDEGSANFYIIDDHEGFVRRLKQCGSDRSSDYGF